mmetsp:Transcript_71530/g.190227  ORF Transcript_71530/g.190227 Transcript_71530/m.190227 type:complete len:215 (+) Transcript_71530:773-1417(+)
MRFGGSLPRSRVPLPTAVQGALLHGSSVGAHFGAGLGHRPSPRGVHMVGGRRDRHRGRPCAREQAAHRVLGGAPRPGEDCERRRSFAARRRAVRRRRCSAAAGALRCRRSSRTCPGRPTAAARSSAAGGIGRGGPGTGVRGRGCGRGGGRTRRHATAHPAALHRLQSRAPTAADEAGGALGQRGAVWCVPHEDARYRPAPEAGIRQGMSRSAAG